MEHGVEQRGNDGDSRPVENVTGNLDEVSPCCPCRSIGREGKGGGDIGTFLIGAPESN